MSVVRVQSVTTMLTTVRTPPLIDRPSHFLAEKGLGDAYLATRGCTLDVCGIGTPPRYYAHARLPPLVRHVGVVVPSAAASSSSGS